MRAMINSDIEMVDDMMAAGVPIKSEPTDLISFCDDIHTEDESSSSSSSSAPVPPSETDSSDGEILGTGSDRPVEDESLDPCRKWVVFHPQTIQVVAEQSEIHENLTEDVAHLISEDVSYRIRELTHFAAQLMRHSFRKKLTTLDVFKAMQELDCDLIFGHNNVGSTQAPKPYFSEVPLAEVFVPNDSIVDLKKQVSQILNDTGDPNHYIPSHSFEIEWFIAANSDCDHNDDEKSTIKLIDEYFTKLIKILLPSDDCTLNSLERERCVKIFYIDLMENTRLKPLLCPLLYFIRNTLIVWNDSFREEENYSSIVFQQTRIELTKVFLNVLHSITCNDAFVDLTLNSKIVQDLSGILLMQGFSQEPCLRIESYFKLYHHILDIRSSVAYQFSRILYKFSIPFTDAQHRLLKMLYMKIFERLQMKIQINLIDISPIDFTILRMFQFMGFDMCLRYLLPLLIDNQSIFNLYLSNDENVEKRSKSNGIIKEVKNLIAAEIGIVGKYILKGLALLLVKKPNDMVMMEQSNAIYSYFYDHFGDSICYLIPPILDIPEVVTTLWSRKRRKRQNVTGTNATPAGNIEKSPNKSHKKKGTGLLESMLSTDTTKMAKHESLSMFTDSLLKSAHKHKKMHLYQQDFDETYPADIRCLTVFEGRRLPPKNEEDDESASKRVRIHSTSVPYKNSDFYNLSVNYRPRKRVPLPCSRLTIPVTETLKNIDSDIRKNRSFDPIRHRMFHYHRLRHHSRISCSLYNQL